MFNGSLCVNNRSFFKFEFYWDSLSSHIQQLPKKNNFEDKKIQSNLIPATCMHVS